MISDTEYIVQEEIPLEAMEDVTCADPVWLNDIRRIMWRVIRHMCTYRQQDVLWFRYFEGMTVAETAKVFGVTYSRIHQLEARLLLQLRGGIDRFLEGRYGNAVFTEEDEPRLSLMNYPIHRRTKKKKQKPAPVSCRGLITFSR